LFALALLIPMSVLVLRVYDQLRSETFYQYRQGAEDVAAQINRRVAELLEPEEKRAFDDYRFFKLSESKLLAWKGVSTSPLSEFPVKSNIPGIIGYFQISPDGEIESPVLPAREQSDTLSNMNPQELAARSALRVHIQGLLGSGPTLGGIARTGDKSEPASLAIPATQIGRQDIPSAPQAGRGASSALAGLDTKIDSSHYSGLSRDADQLQAAKKYKQLEDSSSLYRQPRKEQFNVVTQQTADSLSALNEVAGGSSPPAAAPFEKSRISKLPQGFQVLATEGQIDPLRFALLPGGEAVFFRKAWRDKQPFVQGFIVQTKEFLDSIAGSLFGSSNLSEAAQLSVSGLKSLFVSYGRGGSTILVFQDRLIPPLDSLDMIVTAHNIPYGPGAKVVDFSLGVLLLVMITGLFVIYRFGAKQISLAEQRSNFVSAVSHELNTPLTSIRMYGEMLRSGIAADEAKKKSYYDFIFHESERLSRLIGNVLQVAKLSRDSSALELKPLAVGHLLDLVRSKVVSQVQAAGFELALEVPEDLSSKTVMADEDAVVQILINLVDNAIKFSKGAETKRIVIGARLISGGESIAFFVRDFGPGIDRTLRKNLFRLFYRGESELTRTTPGTGIGLALVKELALRMRAKVDLRNMDPGAEFMVIFD
ncbi:MAG: hypothetical protein DCC75_06395, partial [Proteobacteria bacterium]